ncbi:hypothetical protein TrispH2_005465 [Trichoplax sp. H2]|nr:hypothetical protein TrispH2_005465 [Trichoplax sp. H2]|eukprot:RDD42500.1 hypothetical protein TrispH2_005465 [Trichoplax sp. H2]
MSAQEVSDIDQVLHQLQKSVNAGARSVNSKLLKQLQQALDGVDNHKIKRSISFILDVVKDNKSKVWLWQVARVVRLCLLRHLKERRLDEPTVKCYRSLCEEIAIVFGILDSNIGYHKSRQLSIMPPYLLYYELRIIEQQLADCSDEQSDLVFAPFNPIYISVQDLINCYDNNEDPNGVQMDQIRPRQNKFQDILWELCGFRNNTPFDLRIYLTLDLLSTLLLQCEHNQTIIQKIAYLKINYNASAVDENQFTYGLQDYLNQLLNDVDNTDCHNANYNPQRLIVKYVEDATKLLRLNDQLSPSISASLRADLKLVLTKASTPYLNRALSHLDLETEENLNANTSNNNLDQIDGNINNELLVLFLPNLPQPCIGRKEELSLIDQQISQTDKWSISQVAITGLGGAGKTYVALQYARTCLERQRYNIVYWIHSETVLSLQSSLISLTYEMASKLSLDQDRSIKALCEEVNNHPQGRPILSPYMNNQILTAIGSNDRVQNIISKCSQVIQHSRQLNFLLIYDNADNIEMVSSYIPSCGNCHIIITSRNRNWPNAIDIGPFDRPTSICYLSYELTKSAIYQHHPLDEDLLDKLSDQLGDLPLALSHATRYIIQNKYTIEKYMDSFEKERSQLWHIKYAPDEYKQYGQSEQEHSKVIAQKKTIRTTWTISMDSLRKNEEMCYYIMQYLAYLRPDNIPKCLIIDLTNFIRNSWYWYFRELLREVNFNSKKDKENVQHYIDILVDYSFLYAYDDNYSIHRLLQQTLRDKNKVEKRHSKILYTLLSYFDSQAEIGVDLSMHAYQCCKYTTKDTKLSAVRSSVLKKVKLAVKSNPSDAEIAGDLEFDLITDIERMSDEFNNKYSSKDETTSKRIFGNLSPYMTTKMLLPPLTLICLLIIFKRA